MKRLDLTRFREPALRKRMGFLVLGKLLGLGAALLVIASVYAVFHSLLGTSVQAAVPALKGDEPYISPINTAWTLIAAFLVFFMQAGFMCLEAGFARERESINIVLEGIVDTCLCGLLFWAFGFAFMFGSGNGFIGHQYFFLNGAPATYGATGVPMLAFWLFQFAFADTCSTITSGAMLGRTGFIGDLYYSVGVSGFIYP
ncbi:MAG: ammonium transporter, partial [Chloroflexi bacterium]|nr:ammonium transporter [Chloroflexota bacterium]